jgi:hypothetical protein
MMTMMITTTIITIKITEKKKETKSATSQHSKKRFHIADYDGRKAFREGVTPKENRTDNAKEI